METPCIKVCKLTPAGLCEGCGRTRSEIASWSSYSDEQRRRIMAGLKSRLKPAGQ